MYSKEDGTPAAKLEGQIHGNTKKSRYNKIMQKQQKIATQKMKEKVGQEFEVLVENISFDGEYLIGRTMQDVPDIDGLVYIKCKEENPQKYLHQFIKCKIIDSKEYDLIATIM